MSQSLELSAINYCNILTSQSSTKITFLQKHGYHHYHYTYDLQDIVVKVLLFNILCKWMHQHDIISNF